MNPTRRETLIGGMAVMTVVATPLGARQRSPVMSNLIIINVKVTTLDRQNPVAEAARRSRKRLECALNSTSLSDAG